MNYYFSPEEIAKKIAKLEKQICCSSMSILDIGADTSADLTRTNTIQFNDAGEVFLVNNAGENVSTLKSYKVYTAQIQQTGTNAPVVTVLENTLGGTVVWSRFSGGLYRGTLAGAFPKAKTFCLVTRGYVLGAFYHLTPDDAGSGNFVELQTYNTSYVNADDLIKPGFSFIEIRVYN